MNRLWHLLRIGVRVPDPELRRGLMLQALPTSRRVNALGTGLVAFLMITLRGADPHGRILIWGAQALVLMVVVEFGYRRVQRWAEAGGPLGAVTRRCAAIGVLNGWIWGSTALIALPDAAHGSGRAMIAGVTLMAIATVVVVGAATNVLFTAFHVTITAISTVGFFVHGAPESAVLVLFASSACLPLRGELSTHLVESVAQARRNAELVRELDGRRSEVETANLRLTEANIELSRRATRDPLTGLANRDLFLGHLADSLGRTRRDDVCLSVVFFDLDHFKPVNDTLGHGVGDRLLTAVARRVAAELRDADLLSRLGGDEFTIVTVTGSAADAVRLAERVRAAVDRPFPIDGHQVEVSASLGVATAQPGEAVTTEELLERADAALYRSKRAGRNRVHVWTRRPDREDVPDAPAGRQLHRAG